MRQLTFKDVLPHVAIIIWLLLYFSVLSYKVISRPTPFFDWDESIYVQVGKEMVEKTSLVPLWQGKAWLEKPPLAPFVYGLIINFVPINPEVSTRVASVILAILMLTLLYFYVRKAQNNTLFATFVTIVTSINPIVLHRSQIVNTDVFLLIGWLGYLLFFNRFKLSLFFLFIGVFSKSLLGFYPLGMVFLYHLYQFIINRDKSVLLARIKELSLQVGIMALWFVVMTIVFGMNFINVHFEEHLLKRFTKSIETHFGNRTYYLDIVFIQYGMYSVIALISAVILTVQFFLKKITLLQYFLSLALAPWFIILNLTKTKLEWYVYPAIPPIVFLMSYPLLLIKHIKPVFYFVMILILLRSIVGSYSVRSVLTMRYSSYGNMYSLTHAVKEQCAELNYLVDQKSQKDYEELKRTNLLISTTEMYGTHPSQVFYSTKPVHIFYNREAYLDQQKTATKNSCWAFEELDADMIFEPTTFKRIDKFGTFYLYQRI